MFKFELLENEKILKVYRQTEAVLIRPVLTAFALLYFPWYFLLKYDFISNYIRLLVFWSILVILYAIQKYIIWLLNVYLLTTRRLIKVHYKNLMNKKVTESPLDKILNISYVTKGFLASVLGFGDVEVQVAGLSDPLLLKHVSQPAQVKDFLWQVHNKYGQSRQQMPDLMHLQPRKPNITNYIGH